MSKVPWFEILNATEATIYMVLFAGVLACFFGLLIGLVLFITRPHQLQPHPLLHKTLSIILNTLRSVPFIILMLAIIPITRFVVGTSIGTNAAIVPLTVAATPFFSRMVENSFNALPPGLTETALALGANTLQIIRRVFLPEALPALVHNVTTLLVSLVSFSAMAGAVGGGGLGDLAIRYGYQRFNIQVMLITLAILIILVQAIQFIGERCARLFVRH